MPESDTTSWRPALPSSVGVSGPGRSAMLTRPRSLVNLTAFERRFDTTWRSFFLSPMTTPRGAVSTWIVMPRRLAWGWNVATSLATTSARSSAHRSSGSAPLSRDDTSSTEVIRPSS